MKFDQFVSTLQGDLGYEGQPWTPTTTLNGLDLDSLERFELILAVVEMTDRLDEELVLQAQTLDDLYRYYCQFQQ